MSHLESANDTSAIKQLKEIKLAMCASAWMKLGNILLQEKASQKREHIGHESPTNPTTGKLKIIHIAQ